MMSVQYFRNYSYGLPYWKFDEKIDATLMSVCLGVSRGVGHWQQILCTV